MHHGRNGFKLHRDEAAVWTTYDEHLKLLAESVHAAGAVFAGTKIVLAVFWTLEGFRRPADIAAQAKAIAESSDTHKGARGGVLRFN